MGHFLTGYPVSSNTYLRFIVPLPSLLDHGATRAWFIWKTWILNSKRKGKERHGVKVR